MKKIVWNGNPKGITMPGIGRFTRGEPVQVTDEVYDGLIGRPGFEAIDTPVSEPKKSKKKTKKEDD